MVSEIMALYSILRGKVKSRMKNDGDLRLKNHGFPKSNKQAIGVFMDGESHNVVVTSI